LFEKEDRIGGLLGYGIPDFKLAKTMIDRRMAQMRAEGVEFHTHTHVGVDIPVSKLAEDYDAVVLAGGSEKPRDLDVPGRSFNGIHFAMDFLRANSKRVQGVYVADEDFISANDKHVVVIGGGDTGSDCIGTSNRHGARSITQIEILDKPPVKEDKGLTWPNWPNKLRTSTSQEEGCERLWNVLTKSFEADDDGNVKALNYVLVRWDKDDSGRWRMSEVPDSEGQIKADLVLLAMGFVHPVHEGMLTELQESKGLELDPRGNVKGSTDGPDAYYTNVEGVFAAGDMRRGQSLVVWAIREGRQCARAVDEWLMGSTDLPR
jgi:glutamate synthase (NADPH/NADH) small chain